MIVLRTVVLAAIATLGGPALAQKSANQCAKEVGKVAGEERQKKMIDCLLAHVPKPKKEPSYVRYVGLTVNSAGGVEPRATFNNPNKDSAIKYIRMEVALFNGVGDPVQSTIGQLKGLTFTGPLSYDDELRVVEWDPIAYNASAKCLKITSLAVEFMNGQTAKFEGPNLSAVLNPLVTNDCSVKVK